MNFKISTQKNNQMKKIYKTIMILMLSGVMITALAFTRIKNKGVIIAVNLEVKNFTEWKKTFDSGAAVREKAGIRVITVCSSLQNENQVMVIEEADNEKSATDFLAVLKSKQKEGDIAKLDVKIYNREE
jgi:hypothetical protein